MIIIQPCTWLTFAIIGLTYGIGMTLRQPAQATENVLPLTKARSVPQDVLSRMPRGGKSLRFGSDRIGPQGRPVLLHLYQFKGASYLDFFERTAQARRPKASQPTLMRLNSIRLDRKDDCDPATGTFSTHWLDPQEQQMPLLKIEATGGGGFGGLWFLYVFPQGLKGRVIRQTFDFSFGSNGYYRSLACGPPDDQGLLTVRQSDGIVTTSDMTPEQVAENNKNKRETIFHWNVDGFVAPDDPSIVQVKSAVGIGSSGVPLLRLAQALEKDTTSRLFRLTWSFMIAGDGATSTALYDRQKGTLKFYSVHEEITGYKYRRSYLYSKVTDDSIEKLAAKYGSDEETITDTSFIEHLTEFGCEFQDLSRQDGPEHQ
jgi:hypothetical protein